MVPSVSMRPVRRYVLAALCALATAAVWQPSGYAQAGKGSSAELDALIKAAKAEGEVTFYSAQVESIAKRFAEAFTAKYGIKAQFIRLASGQLQQRYAAEAQTGNIPADFIFNAGNAVGFAQEGIKKGWVEPISEAGLPVMKSGEYPARLSQGPVALIQIGPSYIVYNTEKVKGADIPKDWPDLLNPKFKGQVVIPDPAASDANLAYWVLLMNKFGESFLQKMNAQIGRRFASGVPAIQSLAAGEGMFMGPISYGSVQALKAKGAPVEGVVAQTVTGVEMHVMLTARSKARHPNAARLMANYVMSQEGNKVWNNDPGSFGIYELDKLPKGYQTPPEGLEPHREKIRKLLGF